MLAVLAAFGFDKQECTLAPFGSGLINHTWLVHCNGQRFILQRINTSVFKELLHIAENMEAIGLYLAHTAPSYYFVRPLKTAAGQSIFHAADGYFRMAPFVEDSHTMAVAANPAAAFEAAKQFGKFTRVLRHFDARTLQITLPHFHDLELRYNQFIGAQAGATAVRKNKAKDLVQYLSSQQPIVDDFKKIKTNPQFKIRVAHHDTKISNVLFDAQHKGLCVIDLDTVMPGYFI